MLARLPGVVGEAVVLGKRCEAVGRVRTTHVVAAPSCNAFLTSNTRVPAVDAIFRVDGAALKSLQAQMSAVRHAALDAERQGTETEPALRAQTHVFTVIPQEATIVWYHQLATFDDGLGV